MAVYPSFSALLIFMCFVSCLIMLMSSILSMIDGPLTLLHVHWDVEYHRHGYASGIVRSAMAAYSWSYRLSCSCTDTCTSSNYPPQQ